MARAISSRSKAGVAEAVEVRELAVGVDTSLTSDAAYVEVESSARLITPVTPPTPKTPIRPQAELVTIPARAHVDAVVPAVDEPARFASRNWRAEAWERERERESRAKEREPARRRSTA